VRLGGDDARGEAELLLAHVLGRTRAWLFAWPEHAVGAEQTSAFERLVEARRAGAPVAYLLGRRGFWSFDLAVSPAVLIPRPETELLVEKALEQLEGVEAPLLCDVGTGSGCVAVTLLHERARAQGFALDLSPAALAVAARNAARHGVEERLRFLVSDCFDALRSDEHRGLRFDLIASNPPYVAESDLKDLQKEVRDHEPHLALTPGGDGLAVVRRLVAEAPEFLKPGGHLLIEIGYGQHEQVAALIDPAVWTLLDIHRDLQGIPRTVALHLKDA